MATKPATMVTMERKIARFAMGWKDLIPNTCPMDDTMQSPVEVTTKKM
jgi:hypothetical protein